MIHYSVSDHTAEIRLDQPPVNGLGVAMIDDLIVAVVHAAAMIVAGGLLAWLVFRHLGLNFVSRTR